MKEERPDASLFIGLHKLAEQNGDGLVPELYALLSERAQAADMTNVVAFPGGRRDAPAADILQDGSAKVLSFHR